MPRKPREQRIKAWVAKVQPTVGYCHGCQPVDSGETVWVRGDQISIESHLDDLRVPKDLQEDVAGQLHCGDCGNSELGLYDDIGLYTREEREHDATWRAWHRKY